MVSLMASTPKIIALIPARSGSKRVKNKNIKLLAGHPLIAYTIAAATDCGIFSDIIVSTDSEEIARIARHYGAEVPFLRPTGIAGDLSPDIEWVEYTLKRLQEEGRVYDCFSILRPTSPFRQPETIQRAWASFIDDPHADSLRAIEKCKQHPGKMWVISGKRMLPLLPYTNGLTPWHSSQYAALPEVYVQNASLEIAWSRVVQEQNSIAGMTIIPFISQELEGFDINDPEDWWMAEWLLTTKEASLPSVRVVPYLTNED